MSLILVKNYCPCCGYDELEMPAYRSLELPPWHPHSGPPPYEQWYGAPSYDVCACCGFEFGNDDNPGTAAPVTFEQYRHQWLASGCEWFDILCKPASWDWKIQLHSAGIMKRDRQ